jgi:hypothetical protein
MNRRMQRAVAMAAFLTALAVPAACLLLLALQP